MRLCGESLIGMTVLDDVPGIVEGQIPVEPRSKSLSNEGSAAGVMPAGSFMISQRRAIPSLGAMHRWRTSIMLHL
jgi:hypothetical protein